ncbi:uncharacterized protein PGTG_22562 [Puccinia graminis f. sp. tritici CRL 75-36-700-3]|uniref:Uncharacterized protein n=2 Tax=Puccinia graminis f. sp. tritici TaxID=56615 RepID=H6QUZ6_PUCGT|nr:uncharacterized protein PGTG_22562 [Puccinia graminis f. sp. tritici CRL 75-36-700-3]EHS62609.1 hypothetical protein PGTG_22562 [Puccinia graminis f. sp. tritici CRL 75-36-700-3]
MKKVNSDINLFTKNMSTPNSLHHLYDTWLLKFDQAEPPLHLHFHMNVMAIGNVADQNNFLDQTNWPFKITIGGSNYTLFARGYWANSHYWAKVLRTLGGVTGIWLHNDMENNGYACLISSFPSSLAGPDPSTSWVIYSQTWTTLEQDYVDKAIQRISNSNPDQPGHLPFQSWKNILSSASDSGTPLAIPPSKKPPIPDGEFVQEDQKSLSPPRFKKLVAATKSLGPAEPKKKGPWKPKKVGTTKPNTVKIPAEIPAEIPTEIPSKMPAKIIAEMPAEIPAEMPAANVERPSQTAEKPKLTFRLRLIPPTQPPAQNSANGQITLTDPSGVQEVANNGNQKIRRSTRAKKSTQ